MIKKLLKEFAGKLDSVIGNKLDEFDPDNTVQPNVFENVDPRDVQELQTKYKNGEISFDEFRQELDNLAYTAQSERDGEMGLYHGPGGIDTAAGHRAWDLEKSEWNDEDQWEMDDWNDERYYENIDDDMLDDEEDDEEDDESAEAKKDSVFVQLKKITDSFENFEDPNPKKPIIKNPLRHVVTDDGITVEVSYDDAVAIVDLMQADVKPESKQKMQELMQTAEGLESLIDYLSS